MRTVSPHTLTALQQNIGTEPILVVGIEWVEGSEVLYSDQKIDNADYPFPTIIKVGRLDTAMAISGSGDSRVIDLTLDDINGDLKEIFNTHDIHKRPVKVYHHFRGVDLTYKFLVFQGEINSPIVWSEGERTLSFTIMTHIEDTEVGFSMEEGDFPSIPEEALGKIWPLVFGQVCSMETVQVRAPRQGFLVAGEGWHDFTLRPRLCQAKYIQCPTITLGESTTLERDRGGTYKEVKQWEYGPDPECVKRRFETVCNLLYRLEQEQDYQHSSITIRGGNNFPQGETVNLSVDGALLWGTFSGETFTVAGREHPDKATWEHVACESIQDHGYGTTYSQQTAEWEETETGTAWFRNQEPLETLADCDPSSGVWQRGPVGGPSASWDAYEDMEAAGFVWKPAGTQVFLEADAEILHIVSLVPGTVDSVAAYKELADGRQLLMEVPSDYYTVYETDYDGYEVVEIGLDKKLSLRDDTWDDILYVSFTSDVGPNPVDIIEWVVNKYTSLTCDATSFAAVQSKLTNYPCNFWMKDRKDVLTLIHDIAYQSRCATFIRDGVVYITYLSTEPSSVRTLTASDILANSFTISLTETEDLVTSHDITWRKVGARANRLNSPNLKIILKHNIPKYGVSTGFWDYYTQNTFSTILKSATFWLIRRSKSWKRVDFDAPLQHLDLDIFDCITLDVAQFSANPVKMVIESANYNPVENTIHFSCWTPILAGTDEVYEWAWPALQDAHRRFPQFEEENMAGPGYDFIVTPPIDHILRSGYVDTEDGASVIYSSGDQNPSDIGDSAPTVTCEVSDYSDGDGGLDDLVAGEDPAFEALELARSTRNSAAEGAMSSGDGAPPSGSDRGKKKERKACGRPQDGDGCIYEIIVTYITPDLVTSGKILGGCLGGPCWREECGGPCTGRLFAYCHTFSSHASALAFYHKIQAEIMGLQADCGYCSGETKPFMIKPPKGIPDPDPPPWSDGSCNTSDVSLPEGETYEPKEVD